jgi:hypothetical protein
MKQNAPQARFFVEKCAAGKTYETQFDAGNFFRLNPDE